MEWKGGAILMVLISIQSALGGDQSCPPEGVKNIRNGLNLFSHSIDKVRVSTLVNRNIWSEGTSFEVAHFNTKYFLMLEYEVYFVHYFNAYSLFLLSIT